MSDAELFERCMALGGIAVFPADTVYGLACDATDRLAVERLYRLKRRPLSKPSAVMFFDLELALEALPELGARTRGAVRRLLPGSVGVLLPNPAGRYPLACGDQPSTLGLRVPVLERLAAVRWPVLQSSANFAGDPDPRRLEDVPAPLREAADLVLDGRALPGTRSTLVDLRDYEADGAWSVVREGALTRAELVRALDWQYHFDPGSYGAEIVQDIPDYGRLQQELVSASGSDVRRILELGTGTGETARRLLARHPRASLVGIDVSDQMLAVAREALPPEQLEELRISRLEQPLPAGPFDLVASALCIHHLDAAQKADLFRRVRDVLSPTGRFVIADVVVPVDPADARIPLSDGYDQPSPLADQLTWLADSGFDASVVWEHADLAVVAAEPAH